METKRVLRRKRRRDPLPPARLITLGAAAALAVLFLRGCGAAKEKEAADPPAPSPAAQAVISLFDEADGSVLSLPLEEYLVGVVAAEMPASFALEALKAQAVAARTFALRRLRAAGGTPCGRGGAEICTDSGCCQAYRDEEALLARWGESAAYYTARIEEAVYATAGEIAVYEGEPIEALYHSNAGGRTEDAANVFSGGAPYLLGVMSPEGHDSAHYSSRITFSRESFAEKVNRAFPGADLSARKLEAQVAVLSRFESGRAARIRLGGSEVTGRQLRSVLDLPSANMEFSFSADAVEVLVQGYGHGVGMSQYGANAMAEAGADHREILCHYYTGIRIVPWEECVRMLEENLCP